MRFMPMTPAVKDQYIFVIPQDEAVRIASEMDKEVATILDQLIEKYVDIDATREVEGALHIVALDLHCACRLQKILDSLNIDYVPLLHSTEDEAAVALISRDDLVLTEAQIERIMELDDAEAKMAGKVELHPKFREMIERSGFNRQGELFKAEKISQVASLRPSDLPSELRAILSQQQSFDSTTHYLMRDHLLRLQDDALRLTQGMEELNVLLFQRFEQMNQKLV